MNKISKTFKSAKKGAKRRAQVLKAQLRQMPSRLEQIQSRLRRKHVKKYGGNWRGKRSEQAIAQMKALGTRVVAGASKLKACLIKDKESDSETEALETMVTPLTVKTEMPVTLDNGAGLGQPDLESRSRKPVIDEKKAVTDEPTSPFLYLDALFSLDIPETVETKVECAGLGNPELESRSPKPVIDEKKAVTDEPTSPFLYLDALFSPDIPETEETKVESS